MPMQALFDELIQALGTLENQKRQLVERHAFQLKELESKISVVRDKLRSVDDLTPIFQAKAKAAAAAIATPVAQMALAADGTMLVAPTAAEMRAVGMEPPPANGVKPAGEKSNV